MSTKQQPSLEHLLKNLRRQFGDGAVQCLTEGTASKIPRLSTGSLAVDRALGGGLPRGRIVEVYGQESSGKTTLCLHAVAAIQKEGGLCAFVDAEHALDVVFAQKIGVDLSKLIIAQPDSGEQALDIVEGLVASGAVDLVVVDSVAALTPQAEIEGDMASLQVGLIARLMSKALRKLTALCSRNDCALLFVNQVRQKIGVVFGSPETTPGGNALKFFSSVRMQVRRGGRIKAKVNGEEVVIGTEVKVKMTKNKVAPPFREAVFELYWDHGIRNAAELVSLGLTYGLVEKSGAWYSYGTRSLGQGKDRAAAYLEDHPEVAQAIEAALPDLDGAPKPVEVEAEADQNLRLAG